MIALSSSFSGKPRKASMAAYRQLLAENHVEEILQDVKQNGNRDRKKELPVWLPLAASFNNGTRKAEDAVPSGLYFLVEPTSGLGAHQDYLSRRTSKGWRVAWVSATTRM